MVESTSIGSNLIQINLTSITSEQENDYTLSQYLNLKVQTKSNSVLVLGQGIEDDPTIGYFITEYLRNKYYIKMDKPLDEIVLNIDNNPVVINRDYIKTLFKLSDSRDTFMNDLYIVKDHFDGILICIDPYKYRVTFKLDTEVLKQHDLRTHYNFDRLEKHHSYLLGITNFITETKDMANIQYPKDGGTIDSIEYTGPLSALQSLYLSTTKFTPKSNQLASIYDLVIHELGANSGISIHTKDYVLRCHWTSELWWERIKRGLAPNSKVHVTIFTESDPKN